MNIITRNSVIDLLRIIFALLILGYHGRGLLSGSDYNGAFYGGYIGVEFFFLVSGFLMAASAINTSLSLAQIQEAYSLCSYRFCNWYFKYLYCKRLQSATSSNTDCVCAPAIVSDFRIRYLH